MRTAERQFEIIIIKRRSFTTIAECKHDVRADKISRAWNARLPKENRKKEKQKINRAHTRATISARFCFVRSVGRLIVRFACIQLSSSISSSFSLFFFYRCLITIHFNARARSRSYRTKKPIRTKSARAFYSEWEWGDAQADLFDERTQQLINKRAGIVLILLCNLRSSEADVFEITVLNELFSIVRKKNSSFLS